MSEICFDQVRLAVDQQLLFDELSLTVAKGDKLVIRGASGCGKSSLLKTLLGAFPLAAGRVSVAGLVLNPANLASIRSRIAYVGQEPVLGAEQVAQALLLPFSFRAHKGKQPDARQVEALLARVGLPVSILSKKAGQISGGEKQRIAIARALLLKKTIFIADEVTSALDPESKAAVMGELFRPEITLLSVSHDRDWIAACARVFDVADHKLVEASR